MLESFFKLKENHTNVKTEVVAGLTTFMTMAYILAVNPSILSASGMDANAILMATAIASFIGCFCMALLANYPFALAPGLGLNAYFAYTVVGQMGYSWQFALLAVFVEGLIFIVLSLTNVREAIFNAIPLQLKKGVSVGIGLFVAFLGLQNAKLVVDSTTLVTIVDFTENFHTVGIGALLAVIGLLLISILHVKHVKGSILIGILVTWLLGIVCQLTGIYQVDAANGFYSLIPSWSSFDITSIRLTFGQCFNLSGTEFNLIDFIVIIFAFLFVDLFDTLGTLIGVANKADMLDKDGKLPRIKQALLADALATSAGAILGTYHNNLCRKLLRCRRRRQNRSGFDCNRSAVFGFYYFRTGIHNHSELRNRSGSDFCRLPDDFRRRANQLQRPDRIHSGLSVSGLHAADLQHLGRHLHRCHFVCCHQSVLRQPQEDHTADVRFGNSVCFKVHFPVIHHIKCNHPAVSMTAG